MELAPSRGVFVLGSPRSGTSVLAWALAQHPDFWTSAESDFLLYLFGSGHLTDSYRRAMDRVDKGWLALHEVSLEDYCARIGLGIDQLFLEKAQGLRWVDATPSYTIMADELSLLFPRSRFIHIVRDGRAVVSSMLKSGFPTHWAKDFKLACQTWSQYATAANEFAKANPASAIELRNEDLVEDPEREMRRLFEFLDAPYVADAAEFLSSTRINSSYGNTQPGDVRRPKDPTEIPKEPWSSWTRAEQILFEKHAGDAMHELGYSEI